MDYIISIERQYGSGGREIGRRLASDLGIAFYDSELLALAAKKSGFVEEVFELADERPTNSFLYSLAVGIRYSGIYYNNENALTPDKIFQIQSGVIRQVAQEGPCVIVGRCSDYILRAEKNLIKVFLYADIETRVSNVMKLKEVSEKNAKDLIQKTDKKRSGYYSFYTSKKWGDVENHHISIDTGVLGTERSVELLKQYIGIRAEEC